MGLQLTMNKKAYIAPEMEVVNVETVEMMAQSLPFSDEVVDTTEPGVQSGIGRRGTWGNFWN